MQATLCYINEKFPNYYYDSDRNMIYRKVNNVVQPIDRRNAEINGRKISAIPFNQDGVEVPITRGENGHLVANIDGRHLRVDWLVACTMFGSPAKILRLLHLDNDDDNFHWMNLQWMTSEDVLAEYCKAYGVEHISEIPEMWKEYTAPRNPNVKVLVSNYGNIKRDGRLVNQTIDTGGYYCISYQNERGERSILFTHIMVATLFVPNPDPDRLTVVNHIDGDKKNCFFWNLEWCDLSHNKNHALLDQLQGSSSQISEELIKELCEALSRGVPVKEICSTFKVDPKFVSSVYCRRRWTSISKNYYFPPRSFTQEQKEKIAQLLEDGIKPKEISSQLNIQYDTKFCSLCERIQRHKHAEEKFGLK